MAITNTKRHSCEIVNWRAACPQQTTLYTLHNMTAMEELGSGTQKKNEWETNLKNKHRIFSFQLQNKCSITAAYMELPGSGLSNRTTANNELGSRVAYWYSVFRFEPLTCWNISLYDRWVLFGHFSLNTQYQSIWMKNVNIDRVFEQMYSSIVDGTRKWTERQKKEI